MRVVKQLGCVTLVAVCGSLAVGAVRWNVPLTLLIGFGLFTAVIAGIAVRGDYRIAGLWGALAIAVEAGGMLAAAYAATRTLWLPIGLRFAWNFAEGGIFGTAVSGTHQPPGLPHGVVSGSTWITGGGFGPEGSLFAVLAGTVTTAVFLLMARRRGNLVPARWHRTDPARGRRAGATAATREDARLAG